MRAGGAACWAGSLDCVSWGSFAGSTPSSSGSPADPSAFPTGWHFAAASPQAVRRSWSSPTIRATALTDFADAAPNPRNNCSAITERHAPGLAATIDTKPANRPTPPTLPSPTTRRRRRRFECKLDLGPPPAACGGTGSILGAACRGSHTFQVRATDGVGASAHLQATAGLFDTTAPAATIDTHPADPSAGASVSFTFHSSETGSSFECSLAQGAAADASPLAPRARPTRAWPTTTTRSRFAPPTRRQSGRRGRLQLDCRQLGGGHDPAGHLYRQRPSGPEQQTPPPRSPTTRLSPVRTSMQLRQRPLRRLSRTTGISYMGLAERTAHVPGARHRSQRQRRSDPGRLHLRRCEPPPPAAGSPADLHADVIAGRQATSQEAPPTEALPPGQGQSIVRAQARRSAAASGARARSIADTTTAP